MHRCRPTPPIPRAGAVLGAMRHTLNNLRTIGNVDVSRFDNGYGYDWRITFLTELGDVEDLDVNDAQLAGPHAKAFITSPISGELPGLQTRSFV